ncbi:MAG: type IV pili twitching motility protein PilT [Candidatus Ryanbacteria bacterium RIFCSPHIGHO2_02_FULL_45_43]|uniref:Type IV pili twitching motility protein PilT n=1 Tax=Candidatus Ryanbacteria bacterium RIFCSPHIGHO2_01_45_13 TaxID=1802112 RepID=A0A1G2G0X2_9BACT|nr:MAG: type IV pili twitching motility protein PilT [Candidatus Ryanbacteria bacterium RIFCSPHIGHO2_01_FULL_44_130]OGZ43642.1 MAG: type IV pili twitching motility protein PilT [Candidatus Ryanbacteria bacterium RIFCSPHIGHO2_01_45_13]OGZ49124.1 MAG: type IV pili twitching motility protein PilT [Candidatus Ryanbacteria bacterium RIFCSPHIGHO2_02_FULL_45_43]OGZ50906.1 MAG: type IV pili twitching motility protein PilT [Candidatus Ryanbacteria bacterium RIFCSPHIGHO2_12_FULL_44_20]OGZ51384.1 MAG: typ
MMEYKKELKDLVSTVVRENGSDLHLTVGRHPLIRVVGELIELAKKPVLTPEMTEGLILSMLHPEDQRKLTVTKELDFSYQLEDRARFRVNAFYSRGYLNAAMRLVPVEIRTIEELNLPDILVEFTRKEQGFFLVVGPTGHGKTTTLAAMIDLINHSRAEHIITIEDPIEYLFTQDRSIIHQREVKVDTRNFQSALRVMFRQDVNVGMIGEMRDYETMSAAVTAAETGHLVFSSLHTNDASQTIDRVIDSFPAEQQNQIRLQLSNTLLGIFSQRLLPRISGGRIPAYELLIANSAVKNLIREGKTHEIGMVIDTSSQEGMISLNRSLMDLLRRGEIAMEHALTYSTNPSEFKLLMM